MEREEANLKQSGVPKDPYKPNNCVIGNPIKGFPEQTPISAHTTSKKRTQTNDSKTKVHFSRNAAYKYVTGQREPITIRIDRGLYSRFKPLAKRVYGSVCRAVEIYIIALIGAAENGVHFSNTEKPINIEKIVIERNLRSRRKLEFVEESVDEVSSVVEGAKDSCVVCGRPALVRVINSDGSRAFLCRKHFLKAKPRLIGWAYVKELFPYE